MKEKTKATILIPTMNRSDFLDRLLHYFAAVNCQYWIFLADSSKGWHLEKTKGIIQSLKDKIKVKHFECPNMSEAEAITYAYQFVETPYCTTMCDDDFLCPKGIEQCADFLEDNPDYGAAHGLGFKTKINEKGPYGRIKQVYHYPLAVLGSKFGSQRLRNYFAEGPYNLIFSTYRTKDWRPLYSGEGFSLPAPWARQGFIFTELISSGVSAIRNKVKELDCLYLIGFGHGGVYGQVGAKDWLEHPDWPEGFRNFHDRLIADLIWQDGLSQKEAEEVFKEALQPYFDRLSYRAYPPYPRKIISSLVKKIDRKIPGFKKTCVRTVSYLQTKKETNLLPSLLDPTSSYNQDFLPIYQAITFPPNKK